LVKECVGGGAHGQLSFSTDGHPSDSLVPSLDDLSSAQSEVERRTGSVGVKLLAVEELADVPTNITKNEPSKWK
jgi:hypothetical protein